MPSIYKITFPNGKIYVGQDRQDSLNYYGSFDPEVVKADFTPEQLDNFTVTKTVLYRSADITSTELFRLESEYIAVLSAYDPAIGYNRNGQDIPHTYISPRGHMFYFRRVLLVNGSRHEVRFSLRTRCPATAKIRSAAAFRASVTVMNEQSGMTPKEMGRYCVQELFGV